MKVFKFGGASVKNAEAVKNLAKIIKMYDEQLVIVVSAMGKTTNAFEELLAHYFNRDGDESDSLNKIYTFHLQIVDNLFPQGAEIYNLLTGYFNELKAKLQEEPTMTYNFEYDQIVSYGEIISTAIINEYLNSEGISSRWADIRKYLKTNDNFREAKVDFILSENLIREYFSFSDSKIYVTQGFIASTQNNLATTLGREGSDYTAALLAYFLNAKDVTVWKDVPGVLNADPKWFDNTVKLEAISYTDAIELAYYGASVIHPKTIQPLKQKTIPLWVKSFLDPTAQGTIIGNIDNSILVPCFIFSMDQVLIQILPRDLSFIEDENLGKILGSFARFGCKINLMQNSAVSFKVCVNNDFTKINNIIHELSTQFDILCEKELELITIRYYDEQTIERVMLNKDMLLEQRSKQTMQMVVKDLGDHSISE